MLFRLLLVIVAVCNGFAAMYVQPTPFSESLVQKQAKAVSSKYHMPVITWADALLANDNAALFPGGIKLVDDPYAQMNDVINGHTPFVRQTVGSGVLIVDALKKAGIDMEVFHSVSDSLGGDVIVAKQSIKNLNTLKQMVQKGDKPTIAIQWGGPHMGWLIQLLDSLKIGIDEVNVKFTQNLYGNGSPEAAIAEDPAVDLAFVISPSAATLTTGEYAVSGLHVLTSTKVMADAIKDVIFVRKDWAASHAKELGAIRKAYMASTAHINQAPLIKKTAALLFGAGQQGIDDLIGMRDETRFHNEALSNEFLFSPTSLVNFDRKTAQIIASYVKAGYIKDKKLKVSKYNWNVHYSATAHVKELSSDQEAKVLDKVTHLEKTGQGEEVFKLSIYFKPNQSSFSQTEYAKEFAEATKLTATYGGAIVKIIGNVDPQLLRAWNKAIEFKQKRDDGNLLKVQSYLQKVTGEKHDLRQESMQLVKTERNNVQNAARQTSKERANAVKRALIEYAKQEHFDLDATRLVVLGDGGESPVYPRPKNQEQFLKNMRVEFVITNYNAEISKFTEMQDF